MAKGFKVSIKGHKAWEKSPDVVYEAVKNCMDDIRDDVIKVSSSLAPHKTGALDSSARARRYYRNLNNCWFSVTFYGDNKGFDYATWTHDETYNLGEGSRRKRPVQGRFAKGALRVGKGYLSQVEQASEKSWKEFIDTNVKKKLRAEVKKKSK